MRKFFNCLLIGYGSFLSACNNSPQVQSTSSTNLAAIDGHPDWIEQGNIYEVNTRQYTPEGTFKTFEKHLPQPLKL